MTTPDPLAHVLHVPWAQFIASWQWRQGEHVSVIGPTGSGKSVLMQALLDTGKRSHVVILGTKPKDATLDRLTRNGYTRVTSWPPKMPPWKARPEGWRRRLLLWPHYRRAEDKARMAAVFDTALGDMFPDGGWTVVVDEAFYMCHELGLQDHLVSYWTQGRSLGLTLVAGTQRPAFVPLYMYDQATHLFFFADNDETNLRRVGGLGGLSAKAVRDTVAALPEHSFLYVNTRRRQLVVSRFE